MTYVNNKPVYNPDGLKVIEQFGLKFYDGAKNSGVGKSIIHYNGLSGLQALNLIGLLTDWKVWRIFMLGFDAQNTGGKTHFFGDHPAPLQSTGGQPDALSHYPPVASSLVALGVEAINLTRETALTCFKRARLEDFL